MKYQLKQLIHYRLGNKLYSAPVLSRMKVENLHQDWASTKEQKVSFTPFGVSGVFYSTCHGIINEKDAFESKCNLLQTLTKEQ